MLNSIIYYFQTDSKEYWQAVIQHLELSIVALIIALLITLPFGYLASKYKSIVVMCQTFTQILRIVPSLAILFILIPYLGTGLIPAVLALVILALPPLVMNIILGLSEVPDDLVEVGISLGMNNWDLLKKVQVPLALPYILNGIKLALIEIIASATLATYIGAGGLGDLIMAGLGLYRMDLVIIGGFSVALLSLLVMVMFDLVIKEVSNNARVNARVNY